MLYDFGDVVLVPFPFTNQNALKKRPGAVVSASVYNRAKPDIIVMAITSQLRPRPEWGETWLADWNEAGLLKPSVVKPIFATLEQGLIIRRLGVLTASDRAAVRSVIPTLIG